MGLKLLHSADWHLDAPFARFSPEQRLLLKQSQRQIPERIGQIVAREGCQLVLLGGDLFDAVPGRQTLELVKDAFRQWKVPVFIAPGNHDPLGPGSVWETEQWPENVHIFSGSLASVELPELSCRVYGAGYSSMDCPPLLEHFRAAGDALYEIGLLHGDPLNAGSPCCPVTAAQVRASGLTYLALGHIHRTGSFRAGDTLCAWPGCPMGRGWDETGDKGVLLVTLEDTARLRFRKLGLPGFYSHTAESAGQLEQLLPPAESPDFFRITFTGWEPVDPQTVKKQYAYLPNLQLTFTGQTPQQLWDRAQEDSLWGIYFRMLRQTAQQDPDALLAARISRRLLEGEEVALP